jgi:hypothetical protein
MKAAEVLGLACGAILASVGIFFAPSPAYDPDGWGACGIRAAFPIRVPVDMRAQFGLDIYECVVAPNDVVLLLVYLAVVFLISGAVAMRIGETLKPMRAAIAAGMVIATAILMIVFPSEGLLVIPSLLIAIAVVAGAIAFAYLGGILARPRT